MASVVRTVDAMGETPNRENIVESGRITPLRTHHHFRKSLESHQAPNNKLLLGKTVWMLCVTSQGYDSRSRKSWTRLQMWQKGVGGGRWRVSRHGSWRNWRANNSTAEELTEADLMEVSASGPAPNDEDEEAVSANRPMVDIWLRVPVIQDCSWLLLQHGPLWPGTETTAHGGTV